MNYKQLGKTFTFGLLGLFASFSNIAIDRATAESNSASIPEIEWDNSLESFQFDSDKFIGQRLTAKCMPSSVNQSYEGVYGTDSYPSNNSLCVAALHAGKITSEGGTITVQLNPGESNYTGSTRNGVTTSNLPGTPRSMVFIDSSISPTTKEVHLAYIPRIKWDTKFTATGFANRDLVGQRFTFNCPAAPSNFRPRLIYGTDSYAFHSRVCQAAVHAGKITKDGGMVTVRLDPGVANLVGSIRDGIETKDGQSSDRSISFVDSSVTE
ncbi:MAG: LCCL domain-containing protein [Cyanobacteria bacterium P01_C01_bin.72]